MNSPRSAQGARSVRILVVVAVRLYREGMASCLEKREDLAVVGGAATCAEALDLAAVLRPDVVLLDTAVADRVTLVRALRETAPHVKTVLFAIENDEPEIIACAEAGVAGYLPSDASLDDLAATLVRVTRGELFCPPMVAAALLRHVGAGAAAPPEHPGIVGLSTREREVLALIDAGLSNKEIAVRLHIEVATVKNHVHHVLDKLKVTSRGAAAATLRTPPSIPRSARR
jgi:DNA-binding NarL/FixJ family response regulator